MNLKTFAFILYTLVMIALFAPVAILLWALMFDLLGRM